jgi:hypothetical protein
VSKLAYRRSANTLVEAKNEVSDIDSQSYEQGALTEVRHLGAAGWSG